MTTIARVTIALGACALMFGAADVWNTKDYKDWTNQDVNQILTKSPWAQEARTSIDSSGMQRRNGGLSLPGGIGGGGAGGGGVGGGGVGGGGIGGGGVGGGGVGGGGMGMPGGGMGMPGGMGRGGGGRGGGNPGGGQRGSEPMDVTVRWESALPVRQALMKSQSGDRKADAPQKSYIISVTGLRMPSRNAIDDDQDQSQDNPDANRGRRDPSEMRNMLMSTTRLVRKDKDPIAPEDVKINATTVEFLFPRTDAIRVEDKEVTFITQVGRAKVERKFKLKDMVYKGQLEL